MTSDTSNNTSGSQCGAACGKGMLCAARWARGRVASGRLLACRTLRRGSPALALAVVLLSGLLGQLAAAGIGMVPVAHAQSSGSGGANVFHPSNDHGGKAVYLPGQVKTVKTVPPAQTTFHPAPVSMQPGDLALSATATAAAHFVGSDKRLEVSVPAGAVTAAVEKQAGGSVHLHIEELEGPSGGTDSEHVSLGTYAFTLLDSHGKKVAANLAQPLTLTLHLDGWRGAAFDLNHVTLIVNGGVPLSVFAGADGKAPAKMSASYVKTTLDAKAETLTARMPLSASTSGGTSTGTWNTESPEAQWSKQPDTSVDLSGGDLTYSYPIDVPAGQGGLAPKLTLSYDSSAVTGNHNPQATSGWLGEGWNLAVGSISWGEHNVTGTCTIVSCTCSDFTCATWEDSWQFSDAYGNSGELIPPNSNVTAWYDDTTFPLTPTPVATWHLDSGGGAVKVISYTNPAIDHNDFPNPPYTAAPPCFRAFLPDGTIEEFGCTRDSLQFFINGSAVSQNYKANYVYRWDLDAIIDPNGNQIHFGYTQIKNWDKADPQIAFPIDAELNTITYDASACHNRSVLCTGSTWNPAVQIVFQTAYSVTRQTGTNCGQWESFQYYVGQQMRCDDVHDLSGASPAGDPAPTLQSLLVLNDILVQVTTTPSSPSWQTLRDYQFSYEQTPATTSYNSATVTDPATGETESVAGYLDLTKIQEVGDDGSTSLPPLTMSYTTVDEYYVDAMNPYAAPTPSSNCGPTWNKGTNGTCKLWTQSYNARYLAALDNGRGWHETYTWQLARNNTHGVNSGLGLENPFSCTTASASVQASYPCDEADDENWSRVVLTQRQASVLCVAANGSGCGSAGTYTLTSTWTYAYVLTDAVAKECGDCIEDMYWGDNSDGDKLDFYNAHFMGFHAVNVTNPDGSVTSETFFSTLGYGEATSSIQCKSFSQICDVDPWTNPANTLHGRLKEEDDYDTNHTTLLKQTIEQYSVTCPGPGVSASAYNTDPTQSYVGQNTSELDPYNPVTQCEITPKQEDVYAVDGGAPLTGSHTTTTDTYSYDSAGHLTQSTKDVTTNNAGSTPHILTRTQYVWDDAITATSTSAGGNYLAGVPAAQTTEDGSGNVKACTYNAYDGAASSGATGQQNSLVHALLTRQDQYATSCTPGALSGQVSETRTYDSSGNLLGVEDADALAGVSGHTDATDCTIGGTAYSACASFDGLYDALPTTITNALGQKTSLNYTTDGSNTNSPDATNGWGTWLTTSTDANSATTAYGYDALGRLTASALPGDTVSSPTVAYGYTVTCPATGASQPCVSLTTTRYISRSGSIAGQTSTTFYDGWGRPVETQTTQGPAPCPPFGHCTGIVVSVQNTLYDAAGRMSFKSDPYFVTVQVPGQYLAPDTSQPGTSYQYDGLDRVTLTKDPLQNATTTSYSAASPQGANVNDTAPYEAATVVDANAHQHVTLTDGFGRTRYTETFTGNSSSTYALYGTSAQQYDWLGDVTSVTGPNPPPGAAGLSTSAQTTTTYDLLGRTTGMSDADLGTGWTFAYDADGNLLESVDPRGTNGTVWHGYDGLNRELWRNTANSSSGAYLTYSYDTATNGVARVATESFNVGKSLGAGSYTYSYDARGETTAETEVIDGGTYNFSFSYNDAGQPTSVTYSDGEVFALTYSHFDWLSAASTTPSGATTAINLATSIGYSGVGGAAMKPTSASVGNGTYTYAASYDNDLRLSSSSVVLASTSTTLYATSRGYDAVGNVTHGQTTLPAGTDNQSFCYDEQNRLTWASSYSGTGPCGIVNNGGSLTAQSAKYTASYSYDALNRLTSSPLGTYTYGDAAHLHAATAVGTTYHDAYDAVGDMTCRGPSCPAFTQSDAFLAYDNERRQVGWSQGSSSATYAYDGEGNRVAQQSTVSGTTSTTRYLAGGLEEVTTSGGSTTLTKYESVPSVCSVVIVGSGPSESISYVTTDGLGSVSEALDGSGNVTAQQLYGPYGTGRFSLGAMPTAKGYTGQYGDATTGLDYYGARYYDPLVGQFTSADTAGDGLNRYAYVADDPETFTDSTGHRRDCQHFEDCGSSGGGCTSNCGSKGSSGGCSSENCGGSQCYSSCGGPCPPSTCPPPPAPVPTPNPQKCQGASCHSQSSTQSSPPPYYPSPQACGSHVGICAVGDDSKSIFSLIGYNVDQLWVFGKDNIQKLIDTLNDLYNALTGEESNEDTNAVWAGVIFGLLAGIGAPVASPVTALGLHIDVHAIFEPLLASVRNDINGLRSALAYINNADQSGDHQYDNLAYGIVTVTGHGPTPFDSMNWGGPVLVSWQPGSDYVNM